MELLSQCWDEICVIFLFLTHGNEASNSSNSRVDIYMHCAKLKDIFAFRLFQVIYFKTIITESYMV